MVALIKQVVTLFELITLLLLTSILSILSKICVSSRHLMYTLKSLFAPFSLLTCAFHLRLCLSIQERYCPCFAIHVTFMILSFSSSVLRDFSQS